MVDYIIKDISNEELLKEVALHEAGHLVFGLLVERLNIGFKPVKAIEIIPANSTYPAPHGKVVGLEPPKRVSPEMSFSDITYSKSDDIWVYAFIFQAAAGFATYKALINNTEYFISTTMHVNKREIHYHHLGSKHLYHKVQDITAIKNAFHFMETPSPKYHETVKMVFEDVVQIIKTKQVKESIIRVQNILLKNQGKRIEYRDFDEIRGSVNKMTNRISILPYLQKYETPV